MHFSPPNIQGVLEEFQIKRIANTLGKVKYLMLSLIYCKIMKIVQKYSFYLPPQKRRFSFSIQTISRLIYSIIGYNYSNYPEHIYQQRIYIDVRTVQWVAEQMLEQQIFKLYFHPLLLQQILVNMDDEIAECHQRMMIGQEKKIIKGSYFNHRQIISSIRKIYTQIN